jgi:hypothetical protein
MDMIFVVSKNFIDNNEIAESLKVIAAQMGLAYANEKDPDYIVLQFFNENDPGYFRIALYDHEWFNKTQKSRSFIDGYGSLGSTYFDYDNHYLFNLLKKLVNKYPDLIAYNELGNASPEHPFVFSKTHFDIAKDLYSLNQPPLK